MTLLRSFGAVVVSSAVMLTMGGCAKKQAAAEGTMAPSDADAVTSAAEPADDEGLGVDDLDALQAELGEVESKLLAAGVSLPVGGAAERQPAGNVEELPEPVLDESDTDVGNRCTRICDLAQNACNLQERICDLAERHAGEPRYAQVCERAEADCTRASTACDDCS